MINDQRGSERDVDDDDDIDTNFDDELDDDIDDDDDDDLGDEDTIVLDTDDDTVAGMSGEINVEELVAKYEAADKDDIERKRAIKRRLEQIAEERDIDLDSTYNFNLNDDDL